VLVCKREGAASPPLTTAMVLLYSLTVTVTIHTSHRRAHTHTDNHQGALAAGRQVQRQEHRIATAQHKQLARAPWRWGTAKPAPEATTQINSPIPHIGMYSCGARPWC